LCTFSDQELQVVVLNAVKDIPLNDPSIVSLVIKDLSAYATLPFLAAFDVPQVMYIRPGENAPKPSSSGRKRVTYVGLTKQVMPLVVETYTAHAGDESMYSDGTVEAMFSVSFFIECNGLVLTKRLPGTRYPNQNEV
jgi:hypothetical protein